MGRNGQPKRQGRTLPRKSSPKPNEQFHLEKVQEEFVREPKWHAPALARLVLGNSLDGLLGNIDSALAEAGATTIVVNRRPMLEYLKPSCVGLVARAAKRRGEFDYWSDVPSFFERMMRQQKGYSPNYAHSLHDVPVDTLVGSLALGSNEYDEGGNHIVFLDLRLRAPQGSAGNEVVQRIGKEVAAARTLMSSVPQTELPPDWYVLPSWFDPVHHGGLRINLATASGPGFGSREAVAEKVRLALGPIPERLTVGPLELVPQPLGT